MIYNLLLSHFTCNSIHSLSLVVVDWDLWTFSKERQKQSSNKYIEEIYLQCRNIKILSKILSSYAYKKSWLRELLTCLCFFICIKLDTIRSYIHLHKYRNMCEILFARFYRHFVLRIGCLGVYWVLASHFWSWRFEPQTRSYVGKFCRYWFMVNGLQSN